MKKIVMVAASGPFHSLGQEVLRNGQHYADTLGPAEAALVANLLNKHERERGRP